MALTAALASVKFQFRIPGYTTDTFGISSSRAIEASAAETLAWIQIRGTSNNGQRSCHVIFHYFVPALYDFPLKFYSISGVWLFIKFAVVAEISLSLLFEFAFMAPKTLTEYERRRLENIKRNDEMVASLKLHSRAQEMSSATKRNRVEAKNYKGTQSKKPKPESPVELRRSLRALRMPPDSSSAGGLVFYPDRTPKSPDQSKPHPLELVPLSMKDAYIGDSSDRKLIDTIVSMSEITPLSCMMLFPVEKELSPTKGDRNSPIAIKDSSENDRFSLSVKKDICSTKKEFAGNGSSDGPTILEETPVKREAEGDTGRTTLNNSMKRELDKNGTSYTTVMGISEIDPLSSLNLASLRLRPEKIARVVPGTILNVCFFPTTYRLLVVAGNNIGNVGFWDVDSPAVEGNGIYLYRPHSASVSGISIQPYSLSKVFTSCYNGFIRLLDVEKESFDLVYSSEDPIFSLSQCPHDAKSLYFGEGQGGLNVWDERAGKSSSSWMLHEQRINSIDFNRENNNLMATSSTDGTACIWDVRSINANKPKSLKIVNHKTAVHSAYFSPSGNCLATSVIDEVGVLSGVDFAEMAMINHNNQTGHLAKYKKHTCQRISSFRAIWGWDDSNLFIGNMGRGVDVISTTRRRTVMTLESPKLIGIPCLFAIHPYKVGILAGANSGGRVYIWTSN
ncbi:hypothetical protein NE237_025470 [Protea cynaroides]|uniref:WD repeat-containing protein 76 n=1 Tax=Protea cynaroides TaxID=273540 RepID=A0A9Q0H740_9MAGN|nr:hypothetical protein NE237_025470 [Protea cynaroides]